MDSNDITAVHFNRRLILERYYKELIAFFSRSLRDREKATEVVHESYARMLAIGADVSIPEPRALLYRIGKNIIVDTARRHKVELQALDSLLALPEDTAPSAEREVEARQKLASIVDCLLSMPRKRREAFVLVRIYGYSHIEAATHLASTVSAIEKQVVRAMIDLMNLAV